AKYTPEGGQIRLTADREGDGVVIRVSDTGVGIEPELLPRVFEPFVQAEQSLARSPGGLGIGLTLVRRLADLHGGTVEAHRDGPGRGSEFVVRLPLADSEPGPAGAERSGGSAPRVRGSAQRVLVVDDNADAADTLAALLRLRGQDVRVVYDG